MTGRTALREAGDAGGAPDRPAPDGLLRPRQALMLATWCGLAAGVLELGALFLRKRLFDPNRFDWMSRHFVWLIPLTDLLIFLAVGAAAALLVWWRPRRGGRLAARLLCALTLLPPLWAGFQAIYGPAGVLLALGVAARLVPVIEGDPARWRRWAWASFPALAACAPLLAGSIWLGDRLAEWREGRQPPPSPGAPNLLLIVLDTVGADHLGLHGYGRPTSPALDDLARRGIRFDRAQATSSWTLPSHGSLFTGRWPHELSAGWLTPLDAAQRTLAEALRDRGYATAGFVANLFYCGRDSGLARGFTHYRDYTLAGLSAFRMAALVGRPVEGLRGIYQVLRRRLSVALLPGVLLRFDAGDRKPAAEVNREFLDWLSSRREPGRPFFAFLNYYDAHYPYKLADDAIHRFAPRPRTDREVDLIENWRTLDKAALPAREVAFARDSYDDCIADLDEHLGRLVDELGRRGLLERTWIVVTSDHGESFGEQPGVFSHGTSLYQPQLHVPLVIVPPGRGVGAGVSGRVVADRVSLRDLPSTILDLLGLAAEPPFPGESLTRLWDSASGSNGAGGSGSPVRPALSEVVPTDPMDTDPARMLENRRAWASLAEGDMVYIRREGVYQVELYDLRADPRQSRNLSDDTAMRPLLERMRTTMDRMTAGPLTHDRLAP